MSPRGGGAYADISPRSMTRAMRHRLLDSQRPPANAKQLLEEEAKRLALENNQNASENSSSEDEQPPSPPKKKSKKPIKTWLETF